MGVSREISPVKLLPSLKNAENTPFIGKAVKQFNNLAKFKGSVNNAVNLELPFISKKTGNDSELVFDSAAGSFENDVNVGLEIGVDIKDESVNYSEVTGIKGFNFDLTASINSKIDWQLPPNPEFVKRTEARFKASLKMQVFKQDIPIEPYEPEPFVYTPGVGPQGWSGPTEDVPFRFQIQPMGTEFLQTANYNTMPRIARQRVTSGPTTLLQNIFPRSVTSLAQGGGRTAIVYTTLDPNDPVAQGTEVELLLNSGGGFQQMGRISNDRLGEFNPEARFLADGRLLVVWQRLNNGSLDGTDLAAFAGAMEIVWAVFDPLTSQWTTPQALTANTHFDQLPRLVTTGVDIFCFWQSNTGNELIGDAQNPTHLHIAKWNGTGFDATVTHSADFADAFEFDVSADSERVRVAYVQDGDADLGAPEDQEIFIVDYVLEDFSDPDAPPAWHAPFQLTINSVPDTRPRFAASSDTHQSGVWLSSALFWDRDGELVQLNNDQTGNFMSVLNDALFPNNADFGVVAYGDELLLHWPDLNDGQPDIAARFLTSGGWSETIFLTQDAASENEVSILVQPNNRFGIIFNRNQANPVQTDLTWLEYAGDTDLAFATPAITFEVSEFDPNQLDVKVNVLNTGGEYVNQVDVSLYERDPTNGGSLVQSVQVNLMGGEQKAVAFAYSIPQTVIEDTLFATIDSGLAITESDENNNTASLKALRPNLAITRATWSVNQSDEYVFSVDVENDSMLATASNDATFELGASVLRNTTVPTLASGETTQLVFTIPSTELFTSTDASITIRADASAEIEESDEFDNDFRLLIGTGSPSTGFVDTDNDGFDDNYELEKFGDLTRDGAGDKDGDGATDLHEFLAGTDPDNPNSLLEVIVTVDQGGNPIVTWEIQPGLTYRLQTTTSLGDPNAWTALGADRPNNGQSPVMEHVTDTSAAPPETRFYRVQIVP